MCGRYERASRAKLQVGHLVRSVTHIRQLDSHSLRFDAPYKQLAALHDFRFGIERVNRSPEFLRRYGLVVNGGERNNLTIYEVGQNL